MPINYFSGKGQGREREREIGRRKLIFIEFIM